MLSHPVRSLLEAVAQQIALDHVSALPTSSSAVSFVAELSQCLAEAAETALAELPRRGSPDLDSDSTEQGPSGGSAC